MDSFSDLLETLDSYRGPWDLDLSAKMEALDPSRAEILRISISQLRKGLETPFSSSIYLDIDETCSSYCGFVEVTAAHLVCEYI